jgi:transcription elongation factor Elf1
MQLPARIKRKSDKAEKGRRSPAHRAWIRGFACGACGSQSGVECAHVRDGTDGGTGIKPSDKYTIPLCGPCHRLQHQIGEPEFERRTGLNMKDLAALLLKNSPHRFKLETRDDA